MINYENYAKKVSYFIEDKSLLLDELLRDFKKSFFIADLGCGDGTLLYSLSKKGFLEKAEEVVGIDISNTRISRLRDICPFAEGVVGDACCLKNIFDNSFDIVISSQLIEHIDDKKMLQEIHRILKPEGHLWISTVVKKPYGFWIYWNKGFKLDPTHIKEYESEEEFLNLLRDSKFEINKYKTEDVKYPIIDLFIRFGTKLNLIKLDPRFYLRHKILEKIRRFKLKVIGYKIIEVVAKVKNEKNER